MHIQLCEHSDKNNILAEEQFGFRTKSTTNNAIYKRTNEILEALNNKLMVGPVTWKRLVIALTIKYYYLNWKFPA